MPQPSSSLATLRPDLAASFEEFDLAADRLGFVGHRVLPTFQVARASGTFGRIPIEQLLQNRETRRAPGAGYARGNWKFETDTFACEEHGAEEPVDDREAAMYAEYFDAEQVSAARAADAVLRNAEKRIADAVFNTATYTGAALTTAVATQWSTVATATPVTDIENAVKKVWENTGLWPNALIINRHVFRYLRRCAQVLDFMVQQNFQDVRPGKMTAEALALVFDLDMVIVAGGAKNLANEGQNVSIGNLWSSSYAMIARIPTSNDIREPGLGRTFYWTGDGADVDGRVETYRDESVRSNIVRFRHDVHEKLIYKECGHLLTNVAA